MKTAQIIMALLATSLSFTSCKDDDESEILIDQVEIIAPITEVAEGDTIRLKQSFKPLNVTNSTLVWSSSDESIATVDTTGLLTALKEGKVSITLRTLDESKSDVIEITVIPLKMEFEADTLYLGMVGNSKDTVYVDYKPSYVSQNIEWTSSNEEAAIVDYKGVVTALSYGETQIVAKYKGISDTCVVIVAAPEYGDYYYSDGSYSKDLKPRRHVTGFVVWVGDPTQSDKELKKDYPKCTHGLVLARTYVEYPVSKKNAPSLIQWSEDWNSESHSHVAIGNAETSFETITATAENALLNKISGYNNSKVLTEYNKTAAVKAVCRPMELVNAYNEKENAPESSSGWYLPSIKELSYILSEGKEKEISLDVQIFKNNDEKKAWKYLNNRIYAMFEKEATNESTKEEISQANGVEVGSFYLWSSNEYGSFVYYIDNKEEPSVKYSGVGPIGMAGYFGKITGTSASDVRTVRAMLAF